MKKKLLCLMLAALMLTSVCAFAEGEIEQPTPPAAEPAAEAETAPQAESTPAPQPETEQEQPPMIDVDASPGANESEIIEVPIEPEGVFQFGDLYGEQLSVDFEEAMPALCAAVFADEADDGSLTAAKLAEFTNRLCSAIKNLEASVNLKDLNIKYTDNSIGILKSRYSAVLNSVAESFVCTAGGSVYTYYPDGNLVQLSLGLKTNAAAMLSDYNNENKAALSSLFPNGAADMTKTEIALAIHDYIALHTRYDYASVENKTNDNPNMYNAYGALVNGSAVCQGYALAYMDLLREMGVDSYFVSSNNINHGWNIVNTENGWYYSDVTWDDPRHNLGDYTNDGDFMGICMHGYFMNTEAQLKENHFNGKVYDAMFSVVSGSSPAAAASAHPNSKFWSGICSGMVYCNGQWYYNDGTFNAKNDESTGKPRIYTCGNICKTLYGTERTANVIAPNATFFAPVDGSLIYARFNESRNTDALMRYYTASGTAAKIVDLAEGTIVTEIGAGRLNIGNSIYPRGTVVYADMNSQLYTIVPSETAAGDVDLDGVLTIADVTLICRHIMGQAQLSGAALAAADINSDGSVGVADGVLLCQMISEGNE